MISINFYKYDYFKFVKCILWPRMQPLLETVPHELEKTVHSSVVE